MQVFKPLFTTEDVVEIIKKDKTLRFQCHLPSAIPCSPTTLWKYVHERKCVDMDKIEEALNENRILAKKRLVDHWVDSNEFGKQITAYRVLATAEEREAIAQGGGAKKQEEQAQPIVNIIWNKPEDKPFIIEEKAIEETTSND